jgi:hypothetical protein
MPVVRPEFAPNHVQRQETAMSRSRKKLRLDMNALHVEAFTTVEDDEATRGTVYGRSDIATRCNNDLTCPCTQQEHSCDGYAFCTNPP